jgi:hypothetical protein
VVTESVHIDCCEPIKDYAIDMRVVLSEVKNKNRTYGFSQRDFTRCSNQEIMPLQKTPRMRALPL